MSKRIKPYKTNTQPHPSSQSVTHTHTPPLRRSGTPRKPAAPRPKAVIFVVTVGAVWKGVVHFAQRPGAESVVTAWEVGRK